MMDCKEQSNQTSTSDLAELPWAAACWWWEQLASTTKEEQEEVEPSPEAFAFAPPPLPQMGYTHPAPSLNWWETAPGFDAFSLWAKPKPQVPACPFTQSAMALNEIWGNYFMALAVTSMPFPSVPTLCRTATPPAFPFWKL